jgi:NTE family protein
LHKILFLLIFLISFTSQGIAQTALPRIDNLVFEGAGIRGIAYAGALDELNKHQLLNNVKRVGGTSSGAITALAIALNYTPFEIKNLIGNTDFQSFNDGRFFFIGGLHRVNRFYGWYKGQSFSRWLGRLIKGATGNEDITFEELHQKGYKDLYVTATDLTAQKMVVFSYEATPAMKIKDAVRMSMAIPLYFQPLFLDSNNKVYHQPKRRQQLHVMVDGGIIGNFPIRIFDSTKYSDDTTPNHFMINNKTLAFRIDSKAQITNDQQGKGLAPFAITNMKTYVIAFYTLMIEQLNRPQLTEEDWKRTVSVCDGDLNPRVRKLKPEQIERLIECGKAGVRTYLQGALFN